MTIEQPKNERIENLQEAEKEAYGIKGEVGAEIDREFERLKLAQALGLKKDVEDAQNKIRDLVASGEKKFEMDRWAPALQDIMQKALKLETLNFHYRDTIYDSLSDKDFQGMVGPDANCDKFFSFIEQRFQVVELKEKLEEKTEAGYTETLFPGKYAIIEGTDMVLYLEDIGEEVKLVRIHRSPEESSLLKKVIQGQRKKT
jgi:hypothetical protein